MNTNKERRLTRHKSLRELVSKDPVPGRALTVGFCVGLEVGLGVGSGVGSSVGSGVGAGVIGADVTGASVSTGTDFIVAGV